MASGGNWAEQSFIDTSQPPPNYGAPAWAYMQPVQPNTGYIANRGNNRGGFRGAGSRGRGYQGQNYNPNYSRRNSSYDRSGYESDGSQGGYQRNNSQDRQGRPQYRGRGGYRGRNNSQSRGPNSRSSSVSSNGSSKSSGQKGPRYEAGDVRSNLTASEIARVFSYYVTKKRESDSTFNTKLSAVSAVDFNKAHHDYNLMVAKKNQDMATNKTAAIQKYKQKYYQRVPKPLYTNNDGTLSDELWKSAAEVLTYTGMLAVSDTHTYAEVCTVLPELVKAALKEKGDQNYISFIGDVFVKLQKIAPYLHVSSYELHLSESEVPVKPGKNGDDDQKKPLYTSVVSLTIDVDLGSVAKDQQHYVKTLMDVKKPTPLKQIKHHTRNSLHLATSHTGLSGNDLMEGFRVIKRELRETGDPSKTFDTVEAIHMIHKKVLGTESVAFSAEAEKLAHVCPNLFEALAGKDDLIEKVSKMSIGAIRKLIADA